MGIPLSTKQCHRQGKQKSFKKNKQINNNNNNKTVQTLNYIIKQNKKAYKKEGARFLLKLVVHIPLNKTYPLEGFFQTYKG